MHEPPFDGSPACPACPSPVRDLSACASNAVGAWRAGGGARLEEAMAQLARSSGEFSVLVKEHFASDMHAHGRILPKPPAPTSEPPPAPRGVVEVDGRADEQLKPFDYGATLPGGQHERYPVLSAEERARGFVRPVYRGYKHVGTPDGAKLGCGTVTSMGLALCETYARDPKFYGATFCAGCGTHLPVGEHGEFVWVDERGRETKLRVGL